MPTIRIARRLAAMIAVGGLVVASCGGDATPDGVASLDDATDVVTEADPTAEDLSREEALLAFASCLREHGIDIEDPTVDADGNVQLARPGGGSDGPGDTGRDREETRAAREACAPFLEDAALGFDRTDRTELEDALYAFASCMRDNGYDMPDPDFGSFGPGAGGGGGPFGELDRDDPVFQEAQATCEDVLAGFERPGSGPPGR